MYGKGIEQTKSKGIVPVETLVSMRAARSREVSEAKVLLRVVNKGYATTVCSETSVLLS